jgi:hypothetical protein
VDLNDLLQKQGIDPVQVIVLRHRPSEPTFGKVSPWSAADKPDCFNAYQRTQGERVEKATKGASYVALFNGHEPGKALFIGLYSIGPTLCQWRVIYSIVDISDGKDYVEAAYRGATYTKDGETMPSPGRAVTLFSRSVTRRIFSSPSRKGFRLTWTPEM